ncbi:High cysteine membrane protein Group 5 [Giardia duodenalis]|uniref:High cysteine membrane protein Group 5 n=1 Tax=Giardia intestinalis (strain ATCC 50803 / WB clone C6) TaxID=184922 RepID=A8BE83_GIAIC|nr:High cysteine membrane protein Group 5 [Giardia intestinalis]KAE8305820.1 High cysteine membrane protein Group 5 [Giardia intestinalis]|eukprot:XP_001707611.1 High cysteine membrane protein Group 5 [Giardia lamblia ATCC 50803]
MQLLTLIALLIGTLAINCPRDHYALGNMCVKCDDSMLWCLSCRGPGACTECKVGYYLDHGYCKPCDHTCKTCNNPNSCLECSANHCRNASGVCDEPGEVYDGCIRCAHDTNKCIQCHAGYFFNAKTFTCTACKANCYSCKNETECEEPSSGYYLDKSTGDITPCTDHNCEICSTSRDTCDECIDGYTLNGSNGGSCTQCADRNCSECETTDTCIGCKKGYVLIGSRCSPCASNCEFCMDGAYPAPYRCINGACNLGYRFDPRTSSCMKCPEGCMLCHYDSDREETVCDRCNTTTDAITGPKIYGVLCSSSTEVSCSEDEFQENGACIRCELSILGCDACSERYNCTKCQDGFYLSGNICVACDSICDTCDGPGNNCKTCWNGRVLKGSTCVPANEVIPYCEAASENSSEAICIQCAIGYYVSDGTCSPCADKCATCISSDISNCMSAIEGYRYNRSTNAIEQCQVENCSRCTFNVSECSTCKDGYYLSEDNRACIQGTVPNCMKYVRGQNKCSTCVHGYGFSEGADPACIPCQKECIEGCYFADVCMLGVCADGFYFSYDNSKCLECPSGCSMCKQFSNNGRVGCTRCASGETVSLSTAYGLHCSGLLNKSGLKPGVTAAIVILVLLLIGVCAAIPFIVKVLVRKGVRRRTRAMKYDRGSADSLLPEGSADSAL